MKHITFLKFTTLDNRPALVSLETITSIVDCSNKGIEGFATRISMGADAIIVQEKYEDIITRLNQFLR